MIVTNISIHFVFRTEEILISILLMKVKYILCILFFHILLMMGGWSETF